MTRSYKSFRKEGFSVRPDAYYRKKNGEPMTTREKQEKDLGIERQSKEDFSSLLELRDISDELHTIKKLFQEQRCALVDIAGHYIDADGRGEMQNPKQDVKNFIQQATEAQKHSANGLDDLAKAERSLNSFERSVSDMIESAENTEKAVRLLSAAYISSTNGNPVQQPPRYQAKASKCGRIPIGKVSNGRHGCTRPSHHGLYIVHHNICKFRFPFLILYYLLTKYSFPFHSSLPCLG